MLQHAADYIFRLKQEQEKLLSQNASLRSLASKYERYSRKDILTENKVNKATSPIRMEEDVEIDEEKAAVRELEGIYSAHEELDAIKKQLEKEKQYNRSLEDRNKHLEIQQSLQKESISKSNLDIIVRAIKQVEGDSCFSSRPGTPMERRTPVSFCSSSTTVYVQ